MPETKDKLRLGAFLSLVRSTNVFMRYRTVEFRRHDSTSMRMMLMNALYLNGGSMTPTELSECIFRSRHSITSMVDTLERQGLVRRKPNLEVGDRRSITVTLTPEGSQLFERMMPVGYEIGQKALSCLSDDEVVKLRMLFKRVREHLLAEIASSKTKPT